MAHADPYAVLGVKRSATRAEIKSAYRKMARKMHPDVDKTPGAEERFLKLKEAYQVLSVTDERTGAAASTSTSTSTGYGSGAYRDFTRTKEQQEDNYSFEEFFRDVASDWDEMRKRGEQKRGGRKSKSLLEELADIGEELVDFLEESANAAEQETSKAKDKTADEYRRAAEAARRDAAKAKADAARAAASAKDDVDDMLAQLKRDLGK